ncbi:uncharacterized protein [Musca autumnalis]|uniref:uncharacterized protein n=1 Tax=Musca autumnalis TaxID=221902 RepID=UPI003CFAB721
MEAELQRVRDEMIQQQEYHELTNSKNSLEVEVPVYDKLLCGEAGSSQTEYFITSSDDIEVSKYEPMVTVQTKGTNEMENYDWRIKHKDNPFYCPRNVTNAAHKSSTKIVMKSLQEQSGERETRSPCNAVDEEVTGADSTLFIMPWCYRNWCQKLSPKHVQL